MKRALFILIVIVVFAGVAIGLGLKLFEKPGPAPEPGPSGQVFGGQTVTLLPSQNATVTDTAKKCYQWYVEAYAANGNIVDPEEFETQASVCFTDAFMEEWPTVIENTGLDPVLLAQDHLKTWSQSVSATLMQEDGDSAAVRVLLGTGSELTERTILLTRDGSGWKIAAVRNVQ